jgi:cytochrome c biogenesis protein CcmG/thiol:disulfide interchange protein DsbE
VAVVAGILLVAFIVFVATRDTGPKPVGYPVAPVATLATGSTAPDFALPRLGGGEPVALAATRGTPTVVNFFASWCRDCQAELGDFATVAARTAGRVDVIGIDANDADGAAARTLLANAHATYPVGVDSQAATATAYLLSALPVTFFLDAQGRVVHVAFGTQSLASLTHWTDRLEAGAVR